MAKAPNHILSNWHHLIEGLQESPQAFYERVEAEIAERRIPDVRVSRVDWREGGMLSAKREYLRVSRQARVIDICGAPFGEAFFVSYWLGEFRGCLASLVDLPYVGDLVQTFLKPVTYYQLDTTLMFQTAVHSAVLAVVDEYTSAKGLRSLSQAERTPVMRQLIAGAGLR